MLHINDIIDTAEFDIVPADKGTDNMSVSNVKEELTDDQSLQTLDNDMDEFVVGMIPRSFAFDSYEQISEPPPSDSVLYGRSSSPFFPLCPAHVLNDDQQLDSQTRNDFTQAGPN